MITGSMVGKDAQIPLIVRGFNEQEVLLDAVIDTGFDDYLSPPFEVIQALDLLQSGEVHATLADGSTVVEFSYTVIAVWDGVERMVAAVAADAAPLVGMALMAGYNPSVDVQEGGQVRLSRLGDELKVVQHDLESDT